MKLTSLALAGALALGAAGVSAAQPAPGDPQAYPPPGGRPWAQDGWRRPDPAVIAQHRADRLRAVLQLRPDQEGALRALIASETPPADAMQRHEAERAQAETLTTPQRLDRMQARLAEMQARFAQRADAVKRFYAQLSPTQQRAFDALHEGFGRHMHGHGGRGMGPGKPPPPAAG